MYVALPETLASVTCALSLFVDDDGARPAVSLPLLPPRSVLAIWSSSKRRVVLLLRLAPPPRPLSSPFPFSPSLRLQPCPPSPRAARRSLGTRVCSDRERPVSAVRCQSAQRRAENGGRGRVSSTKWGDPALAAPSHSRSHVRASFGSEGYSLGRPGHALEPIRDVHRAWELTNGRTDLCLFARPIRL